ncbi:MAG: serine/threonine-protein kinase [Gemmatimonadota bacterium]
MAADSILPQSLIASFREHYELLRETGRGGSATVYLARDLKHDRFVAIKVLNPDLGSTSGDRFLREIQVSAGMQHPHILPTYDSGVADGRLYFVMPFVDGGSLRQRLETATALPVEDALRIARDIGIALQHAHDLGIVHRDVKPENIMFYHGVACLADFGVARAIEEMDPGLTVHGAVVGTPAYMSPEQYAAVGFDGRSDVYSLSTVLYEMIAGTRLYSGATVQQVIAERNKPPSIRAIRPKVPQVVDDLLLRGLAQLPEQRYADARAFVAAIDEALWQLQSPPERVSAPRRAINQVRQHKLVYGVSATLVLLTLGFAWPPLRNEVTRFPARLRADVAPPARRPFVDGQAALARWDITGAQKHFALAVAADPDAPVARLWLAESYALARQMDKEEFRIAAMRLGTVKTRLRGRDSLLADALVSIGMGKPAAACDAYAQQLQRDPLDVLAWYGMGDCQQFDSTVVRDAKSPSGWRFNTSYHSAASAYMRAVTLQPNAHAAFPYATLTTLLPSDVQYVRIGTAPGQARQVFAAYPALAGDTIAFVPYPLAMFANAAPRTISPTQPDALKRNRDVLFAFARQWTTAAPGSADAWEALGLAHEGRGELGDHDAGAGGAIRRARPLATTPLQRTRLAAAQVRMLVKRGGFAAARTLADSILAAQAATPSADVARFLSGLAALTGHPARNAELMTAATSARMASFGIQPALTESANRLFTRAAPGVCDDSVSLARTTFDRALDSYAPPNRRDQQRAIAGARAAALAFPCLRGTALAGFTPASPLDRAQRALVGRDNRRVRAILDSLTAVRSVYRPGDIALDHTVQEAWLRAAAGDSAAAVRQLDLVLEALPTLSALAVREDAQAAALGRAMVLRADLAAARRDSATARRWAGAALDLWGGADASFLPTLTRMRGLTGR